MPIMLDTNVAIHVRDLQPAIYNRVTQLDELPVISAVTRAELEGGIAKGAPERRRLLDRMLDTIATLPFGEAEASRYGAIVASIGYVRGRMLDRMIAAHAIEAGMTLITINRRDFRDIPQLSIEIWPHPSG